MLIFIWKIAELKEQLRARSISEQTVLAYFLLGYLVFQLEFLISLGRPISHWDYLQWVLTVAVFLAGTLMAYAANGGSQGQDFFRRYVSISWIVSIRVQGGFLVLAWIASPVFRAVFFKDKNTGLAECVYFSAIDALVWFRVYKHMKDVASPAPRVGLAETSSSSLKL